MKPKQPENSDCTGVSKIRYKVWDKDHHNYFGNCTTEFAWWMVRDARKFIRTDIRTKGKNVEIHRIEEITIQKQRVVVK